MDSEEREKLSLLQPQTGPYGSTHQQESGQPTECDASSAVITTLTFEENEDHTIKTTEILPISIDEEDDEDDSDDDESSQARNSGKSFHLGRPGLITTKNMWTSARLTESFMEFGDEYDIVPTLHRDNLALVLDPNLGPRDNGTLYYAQQAFYRSDEEPEYVITVNGSIYQRIVKEISDSRSVPCGLYYFCHEGDGARAGSASEDDHVDIRLAWTFLTAVFAGMLLLSVGFEA